MDKPFEGYTEDEVMKGVAMLSIALNHFIWAGITLEMAEKTFLDTLEGAGIINYNDNRERIGEVSKIMTKILRTGKDGVSNE